MDRAEFVISFFLDFRNVTIEWVIIEVQSFRYSCVIEGCLNLLILSKLGVFLVKEGKVVLEGRWRVEDEIVALERNIGW